MQPSFCRRQFFQFAVADFRILEIKFGQCIDDRGSDNDARKSLVVGGVDVLQAIMVVGHAERLGELARLLDQVFHLFVAHGFTSCFFTPHP